MAFIDKCTKMRRCALINREGSGNIEWEGVNIEGTLVLKDTAFGSLLSIKEEDFYTDTFRFSDYLLIYQDEPQKEMWVPREECDFVDVYVHEIGRGIILMDDLLCFKKKKSAEEEDSFIICKSFNVEVSMEDSVFILDDNVGGEADQVRLEEEELESISVGLITTIPLFRLAWWAEVILSLMWQTLIMVSTM